MLYDARRHEQCDAIAWDEARARAMIAAIVADTEARFSPDTFWPMHPLDADDGSTTPAYPLYYGACGVIWALRYLQGVGATRLTRSYSPFLDELLARNRAWLAAEGVVAPGAYLMGETSIRMLMFWDDPSPALAAQIEQLDRRQHRRSRARTDVGCAGHHAGRAFHARAHARTHGRLALGRVVSQSSARMLQSQLLWSSEHECHYWTQDLYGASSTYIDAVHGFVGTASPLIRGRHLFDEREWEEWQRCIENTVRRCATTEDGLANWRARLIRPETLPAAC